MPKGKTVWQQRKDEGYCASVLIDYECLLKQWQRKYAPATPEAPWDERFVTACNTLPSIAGLLDCLYSPDAELRKDTADALVRTGAISRSAIAAYSVAPAALQAAVSVDGTARRPL